MRQPVEILIAHKTFVSWLQHSSHFPVYAYQYLYNVISCLCWVLNHPHETELNEFFIASQLLQSPKPVNIRCCPTISGGYLDTVYTETREEDEIDHVHTAILKACQLNNIFPQENPETQSFLINVLDCLCWTLNHPHPTMTGINLQLYRGYGGGVAGAVVA